MIVPRHGCWPLLAMLALAFPTSAVRSESLEEAWGLALNVNQRLRSSQEQTGSAEETLASARANRLPTMNNSAAYFTLSDKPSYKADLDFLGVVPIPFVQQGFFTGLSLVSQPLYTSGRIKNGIAAAEAGVHAAQSDEFRVALDLKLSVAEAFVNVLYSQRLVSVANSNVTGLESHVQVVGDLVKQKQRARAEQLAAEVELADARQQAVQTRNQLDIARATYNRYTGRPLGDPVVLDELELPPVSEDLETLTAEALAQRPELAGLLFQEQGLSRQADAVRAENRPQVAASAGLLYIQDRYLFQDRFGFAGIAVQWHLDAGVTRHRANALVRRACATAAERADLESAIALQVRQAFLDVQAARERLQTTRLAIEQADENLKAAVNRFQNAVGTNTEVLDALTLRLRTSANHYNALYNAVLAVLRLRRAVGCL